MKQQGVADHSGIYWFRKRVPERLKAKVGKSEIKFSLLTPCGDAIAAVGSDQSGNGGSPPVGAVAVRVQRRMLATRSGESSSS